MKPLLSTEITERHRKFKGLKLFSHEGTEELKEIKVRMPIINKAFKRIKILVSCLFLVPLCEAAFQTLIKQKRATEWPPFGLFNCENYNRSELGWCPSNSGCTVWQTVQSLPMGRSLPWYCSG